ncbi:MAG: hypothetical protein JOY53_05080, partial [Acidobacteriaceae bacterium]|nr:hypothetical protein [Acidobacteriaceae bacterium]
EKVGQIEGGLTPLGIPDLPVNDYLSLVPAAVGIALVGFAEGLGAAKTYAAQHHYEVDADRELIGLGAANLGAWLSSGMIVNGSLSKTAVNGGAGAKTQLSGLGVAVLIIVTLLFLTGLLQRVAMRLDDSASFGNESVLGRPQREDRRRCRARNVQRTSRSHLRSGRNFAQALCKARRGREASYSGQSSR